MFGADARGFYHNRYTYAPKIGLVTLFNEHEMRNLNTICIKIVENEYKNSPYINLSCAEKFIEEGRKQHLGRGDKNEGLIARLDKRKDSNIIERYKNIYKDDLIIEEINNYIELKRRSSLFTAMYCFYSISQNLTKANIIRPPTAIPCMLFEKDSIIPEKVLKDFGGEEICIFNLQNEKNISNILRRALCKSLVEVPNGISCMNIFSIDKVNYSKETTKRWECPEYKMDREVQFPYELRYKGPEFFYQEETRIIINPKLHLLDKENKNKLIHIDNLLDQYYSGVNFDKDLRAKIELPVYKIIST